MTSRPGLLAGLRDIRRPSMRHGPGADQRLRQGPALHQPGEEEEAVEAHGSALEARQDREGVLGTRRLAGRAALARRWPRQAQASPAGTKPTSAISWRTATSSRPRLVARARSTGSSPPCSADMVGVGGEPVGEVDAQPVRAEATEGERGAARIGVRRRGSRAEGCGQPRHGLAGADAQAALPASAGRRA